MKFLGVTHSSKTSYHPAANVMVERFYRRLKSALYAHSCSNPSLRSSLPYILLGVRSSLMEDMCLSSSQLVYVFTLSLLENSLAVPVPRIPKLCKIYIPACVKRWRPLSQSKQGNQRSLRRSSV
ncbi:unnamed protein product [Lepeophtheirus salmonis]|uniref:(salmon louse) hypothetical protein n=1 Tax=Lepeophtheirus salmonis TaxID=72036 RepID=A0A817FGN2_LEPSM|nr:unnamed protein product [Lepeophtheirus salmonis]CAG9478689.1 unnamed protein product [Lepeophtheirus salmonis]